MVHMRSPGDSKVLSQGEYCTIFALPLHLEKRVGYGTWAASKRFEGRGEERVHRDPRGKEGLKPLRHAPRIEFGGTVKDSRNMAKAMRLR